MKKFALQLAAMTTFAIGLIWFSSEGEALQVSSPELTLSTTIAAAGENSGPSDTVHINIEELSPETIRQRRTQERDQTYAQSRKLTQALYEIRRKYMDEVNAKDLVDAAIKGMLQNLDRYSVLMERQSYDNLMEHTSGRYQGVGMQIDSRNDYIVIISPLEGGPAEKLGLRAGDVIKEIEGQSTFKMKTSEASKLMRGDAGTPVNISVEREGLPDVMNFAVVRDYITLHSVNYAGRVPGTDYGYIRLSTFASNTSAELRQAIAKIEEQNLKGLVFDLRSNGGGLLDQAVNTAELFTPKGSMVVYTQGQDESSRKEYFTRRDPLYPDKPLIVLVDEGTASASEIVAGCIQDLDRGIVLGRTTFGKGLVQQVFGLEDDPDQHLKLTTARYYVPSGRCIQRLDRQGKDAFGFDHDAETDSLKIEEREIFYTVAGREVYGGGGIVPDVESERDYWDPITINMRRQSMFFDFASAYLADHPDGNETIEVTSDIVEAFREFVKEREFDYKTALQVALEEFQETVDDEERTELFAGQIEKMNELIAEDKADDFDESIDDIKLGIRRELVSHIGGEKARYEQYILPTDPTVAQAVRILSNDKEFTRILTEGAKRAELDSGKRTNDN